MPIVLSVNVAGMGDATGSVFAKYRTFAPSTRLVAY
jgi:hypothetical protein